MSTYTLAGAKLAVSVALPATEDEAGYDSLTWVEIGEIESFGERGRSYTSVQWLPLSKRREEVRKGSYTEGAPTYVLGKDIADAGQVILAAGLLSDDDIAFKEIAPDGSYEYFSGVVLGLSNAGGDVNTIQRQNLAININVDVIGPFTV